MLMIQRRDWYKLSQGAGGEVFASVESPEANKDFSVPVDYRDLVAVFSPIKATQLHPYHEWERSISLREEAVPPQCRIYPLSQEEEQAMEQYIREALPQGYIRPSTPHTSASVSRLRPCVDYRGLNELLVNYLNPLPLSS
ncbi:hypothetical protein P4O66_017669 [Electrophorus voltai]|uniref:Uncharacterized protein n=1 Tax=Electrophorus voltai TaxID=2609070 RepID=A0AAD8YRK9_9TELE|nr:hypothetical protein P4O66_017669 [Electrophorus voltai]